MKRAIRDVYDALAEPYAQLRKEGNELAFYKDLLEKPYLYKLLGGVRGKRVLDLGCGTGVHARELTKRGAIVTGIDNSEPSLALARLDSPDLTFVFGDVEKLPFKNSSFDVLLSAMVLGHLPRWDRVLGEVHRVLKRKGIFVFSSYNPFKEVQVKRVHAGEAFRVIEDYFTERTIASEWENGDDSFTITHHHKTYATIIKALIASGFRIVDYEDCKPPKRARTRYPNEYAKTSAMPNFSVWKLVKA